MPGSWRTGTSRTPPERGDRAATWPGTVGWAVAREGATGPAGRTESTSAQPTWRCWTAGPSSAEPERGPWLREESLDAPAVRSPRSVAASPTGPRPAPDVGGLEA